MELYINQEELLKSMAGIQGVVERRSTNQLSSQAILEAKDEKLRVTATDGEITLVSSFPANVESTGEIAVNAAHFFQVVRSLPTVPVHLVVEENQRIVVDARPAHFKIMGGGIENFPALPVFDTQKLLTVKSSELKRIIEQTIFAIPLEDNRYGLNGGHFESIEEGDEGPKLRLVTTDGSRLCYSETSFQGEFGMGKRMLVSRKALTEIRKLCENGETDITMGFGDRTITVTAGSSVLHARLVDGEFPPYRRVLPSSHSRKARIQRLPFLEALRRVSLEAQDKASTIRIQFDREEAIISARSVEHGEARHPVPIDFQGTPITMGFNVRYFLDVIACVGEEYISLNLEEALSPCIIRVEGLEGALFVIMPIRLE